MRGWCALTAALAMTLAAGVVFAQSAPALLTGTLKKARDTGTITIGYRSASLPFSYLSARGAPIGYSIDLCGLVVEAIGEAVDRVLDVKWRAVTPDTRVEAVRSGAVDLECGSTTNSAERRKVVAFSPVTFVAGTRLMVRRGSPIRSFRDLKGRKVAVTSATTNETAMRDLVKNFALDVALVTSPDHAATFDLLATGKVDAVAGDDVLLYGFIAEHASRDRYQVVGEFLSYDPYGIMFRKDDPALAEVVNDTFRALARDRELERRYDRWFMKRLPSGQSLDLPMGEELRTIFGTLGSATPG
jgi:glutamate/aspartate transport system substrate-binding protein